MYKPRLGCGVPIAHKQGFDPHSHAADVLKTWRETQAELEKFEAEATRLSRLIENRKEQMEKLERRVSMSLMYDDTAREFKRVDFICRDGFTYTIDLFHHTIEEAIDRCDRDKGITPEEIAAIRIGSRYKDL
jgi:chromosome segregation ATPase